MLYFAQHNLYQKCIKHFFSVNITIILLLNIKHLSQNLLNSSFIQTMEKTGVSLKNPKYGLRITILVW